MKCLRFLAFFIVIAFLATPNLWAGEDDADSFTGDHKTEIFYINIADVISLTSASGGLFKPYPQGIPTFDDPIISQGFLVNVLLRDASGNLIGFTTEQEVLDHSGPNKLNYSDWSLKIPGRGALFVTEVENFNWLFEAIGKMIATGELEKTFDPPLERWTTVPGTGKIIGGTGEFEGVKGEFREFNRFHSISLLTGYSNVEVVLEMKYHKNIGVK